MSIFKVMFKKPKIIDVDEAVRDKAVKRQQEMMQPELKKLRKSARILKKESQKMLKTLDVAMKIGIGTGGRKRGLRI